MIHRIVRAIGETPFEIVIALLSVWSGCYTLAWGSHTPGVSWSLITAIAAAVIVGGIGALASRLLNAPWMRLERSALALLVCAYLCYTAFTLNWFGVSLRVINAVAADVAVAVACAIRIRVLGLALKLTQEDL